MRLMLYVTAAAIAVTAAAPASAELWRLASDGGTPPDRSHVYVDIDSVRRTGDQVTFTTTTVYERIGGNRDYDRSWIQRRANCGTMSSQMMVTSFYAGTRLLGTDRSLGQWIAHKEGTIAHGLLMAVCGQRAYRGSPITDPISASRVKFGASSTPGTSGKNSH